MMIVKKRKVMIINPENEPQAMQSPRSLKQGTSFIIQLFRAETRNSTFQLKKAIPA